jgi:hypothetical protein
MMLSAARESAVWPLGNIRRDWFELNIGGTRKDNVEV